MSKICPVYLESIAPGRPTDETRSLIDSEFAEWIKTIIVSPVTRSKQPGPVTRMSRNVAGMNASKLHRYQYARIQGLYKWNGGRCADEVLSGKWTEVAGTIVQMKDMVPVWRGIMETPSVSDMRTPVSVGPILWQLLAPVTVHELEQTLRNSSKTAPGPDSISWKQLKGILANALLSHFNLWQLASYQPSPMRLGQTVFLEKVRGSLDPLKQRPITIASYVIRTFHKIMENGLGSTLPWNVRQKAFMKGDGTAQKVWLLKNIIEEHKNSLTPLCLAFVDLKKALDSVSHETILTAGGWVYPSQWWNTGGSCVRTLKRYWKLEESAVLRPRLRVGLSKEILYPPICLMQWWTWPLLIWIPTLVCILVRRSLMH